MIKDSNNKVLTIGKHLVRKYLTKATMGGGRDHGRGGGIMGGGRDHGRGGGIMGGGRDNERAEGAFATSDAKKKVKQLFKNY